MFSVDSRSDVYEEDVNFDLAKKVRKIYCKTKTKRSKHLLEGEDYCETSRP